MTSTKQTTIVQLIGSTMDENDFPGFTAKVDEILEPYGCRLIGNGDIIRWDIDDDSEAFDYDAIREAFIDVDWQEVAGEEA